MKKLKPIHFLVISVIINLLLWFIYSKTNNEVTYYIAGIFSGYVIMFILGYIVSNIFILVGKLIVKSGILESKLITSLSKTLKTSAELVANIIVKGFIVVAILAFVILLIVGAGWIIASLSATSVIIILLVLILLK